MYLCMCCTLYTDKSAISGDVSFKVSDNKFVYRNHLATYRSVVATACIENAQSLVVGRTSVICTLSQFYDIC